MKSTPLLHVAILDMQGGNVGTMVPHLQEMGCRVTVYRINRPLTFASVLSGANLYRETQHIILDCHGDDGAVLVRQLDARFMLPEDPPGPWYPDRIRECANIPPSLVFSHGCTTGTNELADAFLDGGAVAVIAPEQWPDYRDAMMVHYRFYYELLHRGCTIEESLAKAQEHGDGKLYRFFSRPNLSCASAMPHLEQG